MFAEGLLCRLNLLMAKVDVATKRVWHIVVASGKKSFGRGAQDKMLSAGSAYNDVGGRVRMRFLIGKPKSLACSTRR